MENLSKSALGNMQFKAEQKDSTWFDGSTKQNLIDKWRTE
jgi:hypothetical protein